MICPDTNPAHLGPEAGKFITALQEFVSSIVVSSQSAVPNEIELGLDEGIYQKLLHWIVLIPSVYIKLREVTLMTMEMVGDVPDLHDKGLPLPYNRRQIIFENEPINEAFPFEVGGRCNCEQQCRQSG
jgi:hypothetical protein